MIGQKPILADSSIWIEHLSDRLPGFAELLRDGRVVCHPAVIGEVGLGSLRNRAGILESMATLPAADVARDAEVLGLVNSIPLHSRGIGWVDAHLVASAILSHALLLSRDRRLNAVAAELGIAVAI
ncbi:type II toxin-antitoxin system VapC family toxin [Sandaracinobacteroides hominis]|uniref:type II toxin-antitoxin system VapC family toxin n=1 Tax=Sandaracinobacteroides hominis TaxID=2780086 RepID=UPI0018F44A1E|nr:type II toxin-antitoxin system VapC family toxin [Sandaracinobacteroides hominis]